MAGRTSTLAEARREHDKAKDLLKQGSGTEKQLDEHKQARRPALRTMAGEWLVNKKLEKVKRRRIVAVRDPKTIAVGNGLEP